MLAQRGTRRLVIRRRIEGPAEIAHPAQKSRRSWVNVSFFCRSPRSSASWAQQAYAIAFGVRWWEPALFAVLFGLVSFSVTAGYHRCFAHKAYVCHPAVQAFSVFFGAMALQEFRPEVVLRPPRSSSIRGSSTGIRSRHPARRALGAHFLALLYGASRAHVRQRPRSSGESPRPLAIPFQRRDRPHRGSGNSDHDRRLLRAPGGGLAWGGFLRITLIHHTTFLVNSVAHLYGTRPYTEASSARDNALLSLITNGEGYHNFHHKFPSDFRNGVRWYQWDPTKWFIALLRMTRLARDLKRTPKSLIEKTRFPDPRASGRAQAPHRVSDTHAAARSPIAGPPDGGMHAAQ